MDQTATTQPPTQGRSHEEIVELASSFSVADVGYGRDEHGRLRDWQQWANSHPERANDVGICRGRHEWSKRNNEKPKDQLSIISWNILSDTWYEKEASAGSVYDHTPREHGVWEGRFPLFLRWVSCLRPDVLALQEVDFDKFDSHLLPELGGLGYDGLMQNPKKQREGQPCGVATFWLSDRLEFLECASKFSRSMAIHFRHKKATKKHVCVINVHLESSQSAEGAEKRARQLNSPLGWAAQAAPRAAVVVCGDCNTGADASLFHVLRTHRWHGHDFASVYEHPTTSATLPVNRATFAVPGHHYIIDHMLYSHDCASLRFALDAFTQNEIDVYLGSGFERGFPNEFLPSDHLPVGAIFSISDTQPSEEKATPRLSADRMKEIESEWSAILSERPPHRKGEPTPEEIESRREYARKVKAWKSSFEGNAAEAEYADRLVRGKKAAKQKKGKAPTKG